MLAAFLGALWSCRDRFALTASQRYHPDVCCCSRERCVHPASLLRSQGRCGCSGRSSPSAFLSGLSYQMLWTYYEVILRRDVPDLFAGDIIIFLHIVPLMAALALRPHVPRDEYAARVGQARFRAVTALVDLSLRPHRHAVAIRRADVAAYNRHLNAVYLAEEARLPGWLDRLLDHQQRRMEKSLCRPVWHEPLLFRQFHCCELGDRPEGLLQRQSLRHSSGRRHGMADLDRPAEPRQRSQMPAAVESFQPSTACGSPVAA